MGLRSKDSSLALACFYEQNRKKPASYFQSDSLWNQSPIFDSLHYYKTVIFVFASHLSDFIDMNSPNDEVGAMCVSEALWFDLSCSLYM